MLTIESLSRLVDEATAAYILETRKSFEDLQQVASQLAGMLLLTAAGSKEAGPDHPALISARQIFRSAEDALHLARPTERARRHHDLLVKAAKRIGVALKLAVGALDVDATIVFLRAGYAELERAADALPGFEKVSYERACCVGGRAQ